jgi:hypothetical protein
MLIKREKVLAAVPKSSDEEKYVLDSEQNNEQ